MYSQLIPTGPEALSTGHRLQSLAPSDRTSLLSTKELFQHVSKGERESVHCIKMDVFLGESPALSNQGLRATHRPSNVVREFVYP